MTIKNAELLTGEQANFINTLIRVNEASGWQAVVDLCKAAAPEGLFHQSMLFGVHFTDVGAEILLGEDGREYREVLDDIYVEVQQHPSVEPLLPMEFIAASSGDLDSVSGWFWGIPEQVRQFRLELAKRLIESLGDSADVRLFNKAELRELMEHHEAHGFADGEARARSGEEPFGNAVPCCCKRGVGSSDDCVVCSTARFLSC